MTIYALSTGPGISGIAVIRVSGKNTSNVIKKITSDKLPFPRVATLGRGNLDPVIFFTTSDVFFPDTLITAIPDIPGPVDKA